MTPKTENITEKKEIAKKDNVFINLGFNIIIPVIILSKFSTEEYLGPVNGLIIALAFPIGYGLKDLIKSKKWNFFSIIGLINILLTGGFSLLELDRFWFAVKEASVPALFAAATLISLKTRYPVINMILLNPALLNMEEIHTAIDQHDKRKEFNKIVFISTLLLSGSFVVSSVLNFILAIVILQSPAGTPEFNQELGKMTALSFPVIMVPSLIVLFTTLFYLITGIRRITGMEMNEILHPDHTGEDVKSSKKQKIEK